MPEELHNSVQSSVALAGDVGAIVGQLTDQSRSSQLKFCDKMDWWVSLRAKCEANKNYNLVTL